MKGREYRSDRRRGVPSWYSGWAHLAVITGASLLGIFLFAFQIQDIALWQLWMIPTAFVISIIDEYVVHRFPMHRVTTLGKDIYKKHAAIHHRYFTHDDMAMEEGRDMAEILTLPRHVLELLFVAVIPFTVLFCLFSWNLGMLFGITALSYYLVFEWIHLASHMPKNHWLPSLPVMRSLCEHHRIHHNTRLMREHNFNIAFPLVDWALGTSYKG